MKVIGVGFGRSGTMSLKQALGELGAGPCFHMIDLIQDPSKVGPWHAAVFEGEMDWDAMFDGFESTIDWPGCTLWRDLIDAFPEAKVLLNYRDFDAFYRSLETTVYALRKAAKEGTLEPDASRPQPVPELWEIIDELIFARDLQGSIEDRERVREICEQRLEEIQSTVPADRLTVWKLGDGWGPLCEMLDVHEPEHEFPHLHEAAEFRAKFGLPALA